MNVTTKLGPRRSGRTRLLPASCSGTLLFSCVGTSVVCSVDALDEC